jgi:hypothetical protein
MSIRFSSLSCILCLATFLNAAGVEKGFSSIFNGKDLTGWEGMPGMWTVKDGAIRFGIETFHSLSKASPGIGWVFFNVRQHK